MTVGITTLKLVSGAGTLAVCGASAVLVMHDPKPASAPLQPPVAAGAQAPTTSLVIPPSCDRVYFGAGAPKKQAAPPAQLSAAALLALGQLQQAGSDKARQRAILNQLPAGDRQAVTAYIRQQGAGAGGSAGSCRGGSGGGGAGSGDITASIGAAGQPVTPITNSYVS